MGSLPVVRAKRERGVAPTGVSFTRRSVYLFSGGSQWGWAATPLAGQTRRVPLKKKIIAASVLRAPSSLLNPEGRSAEAVRTISWQHCSLLSPPLPAHWHTSVFVSSWRQNYRPAIPRFLTRAAIPSLHSPSSLFSSLSPFASCMYIRLFSAAFLYCTY